MIDLFSVPEMYSFTKENVGLLIVSFTPNASQTALMKVVFPAPFVL